METKIFSSSEEDLKKAAKILKEGGRVVFPTETVYGLGASAFSSIAAASIFEAKGRPSDNPLIVHIAKMSQLKDVASEVSEKAKILMEKFWPGPLTVILKKSPKIPARVSAGLDTVGVRMPENPVARRLLELCEIPIAAPSANISGRPSPTDFEYVKEDMQGRVEGIIDGGNCSVGVESTVIDMTAEKPVILRPGGVTAEEISKALGEHIGNGETKQEVGAPKAPGMKYTHYAPKAVVRIISGNIGEIEDFLSRRAEKCGILTFDEVHFDAPCVQISLGSKNDPRECARNLFRALRDMDKMGAAEIYAPEIGDTGLWAAVKNRLYKSAGGKIINASDGEIIFVCTGNTCRSPMAEGFFNSYADKGYFASSAGIYASLGAAPSENAVKAMKEKGIDIKNHRARQLTIPMIESAALVLTLTKEQKSAIINIRKDFSDKVMTIGEFAGEKVDVSDPYGGDLKVYKDCAAEICDLVKKAYDRL